ncbi:MAG: serine/threonine-protein kinase [Acidobacteriota bacterium]
MTDNRWPEIKPLLDRALDLDPDFRASFLDSACGDDLDLKAEIEGYLALESETTDLESPLLDLIAGRSPEYRAGQRMGPYRLDAEIARGGMGVVYQASRIEGGFEQKVAIKILRRGFDTGDFVRRFRSERQILAGLDHPHIARLFDGGTTEDGLPYLVMEPVNGRRLDHYCQEENLDLPARIELLRKICDAVHAAHQRLIVHCDLKPSNILVTADGTPKLLDFGIAKVLRQSPDDETRSLTVRLGTPGYSSPELVAGSNVTTGSDIYALGCLLHLLLTGKAPEPRAHADDPLPLPSRVLQAEAAQAETPEAKAAAQDRRQQVRGDLDAITLKALAWDAQDRYTSADALSTDLDRHLRKLPVSAQPYSWKYVAGRLIRRRRKELAVGLGVVVLVLVGLGLFLGERVRSGLEENRAEGWKEAYGSLLELIDPTRERSTEASAQDALRALINESDSFRPLDLADILQDLGKILLGIEEFEAAREALKQAEGLYISSGSQNELELGGLFNNMGRAYAENGHPREAIRLYRKALQTLSPARPETAEQITDIRHNLAGAWKDLGELSKAEIQYRRSLPVRRTLIGPRSMETARTLNQLGIFLWETGRIAEAEAMLRESLSIRIEVDPASLLIERSQSNLAALLNDSGRFDGAISLYRELLTTRLKLHGAGDWRTARVQAGLASALLGRRDSRDLDQARASIVDARATIQAEKPGSRDAAAIDRHYAAMLLASGKSAEAEVVLRPLFESDDTPFPSSSWRYHDLRSLLGAALAAQGRTAEARPLLEESATNLMEMKGPNSRWTREALERFEALDQAGAG